MRSAAWSGLDLADGLRRRLWRVGARTRWGRACAADRAARTASLALLHIAVAFTLTGVAPLWLLLLGPLLLGVPHVLADVRYLVVRPAFGMTRGAVAAVVAPLALLTALRLVVLAGGPRLPGLEVGLGGGAVLAAALCARGASRWRGPVIAGASLAAVAAVRQPIEAILVLGHAHNLLAFGLWLAWAWRRTPRGWLLGLCGLYGAALVAILAGALDAPLRATLAGPGSATGLELGALARALAPGLAPTWALRLVAAFAFAQAVHYAVWIRLVPNERDPRPGATTFHQDVSALRADFGAKGLLLAGAACAAVPLLGLLDPRAVRAGYLGLVMFHGWLELAVAAWALADRGADADA